jgi:hypothetical protein
MRSAITFRSLDIGSVRPRSSAAAGGNYKFNLAIEMLDGSNGARTLGDSGTVKDGVLERWECSGCYIVTANYNALDYAQTGPQQIDLSIQPDNCILVSNGASGLSSVLATA